MVVWVTAVAADSPMVGSKYFYNLDPTRFIPCTSTVSAWMCRGGGTRDAKGGLMCRMASRSERVVASAALHGQFLAE
jgi:hypothetical protein